MNEQENNSGELESKDQTVAELNGWNKLEQKEKQLQDQAKDLQTKFQKQEQPLTENQVEINLETPINLCQGYLVDPETKLHLCNVCAYHKHRNESKPWLKIK